jgi:hypothetical protein
MQRGMIVLLYINSSGIGDIIYFKIIYNYSIISKGGGGG